MLHRVREMPEVLLTTFQDNLLAIDVRIENSHRFEIFGPRVAQRVEPAGRNDCDRSRAEVVGIIFNLNLTCALLHYDYLFHQCVTVPRVFGAGRHADGHKSQFTQFC